MVLVTERCQEWNALQGPYANSPPGMKRPISRIASPMIVNCNMVRFRMSTWIPTDSNTAPMSGPHNRPEPPSRAIATGMSATSRPNTVRGSI